MRITFKRTVSIILAVITAFTLVIPAFAASTSTFSELTNRFTVCKAENGMKYAIFEPDIEEGQKYPLVIFVHGLSHGWTNSSFVKSGLTYWADEEMQAKFKEGGAYLLMPKIPEVVVTAFQTDKVFNVIDEFVKTHKDTVDEKQIYIMGASAGGALTWRIITDHPGYFKKAIPMCGIKWLSRKEAKAIADTPVWMISAKTDILVWYWLFSLPNWNTLTKNSNIKDQCRHTVFSGSVYQADGSRAFVSHRLYNTIGHNLCYISDDQPIKGCTTIDGNKSTVTICFDNSVIEWLQNDIE